MITLYSSNVFQRASNTLYPHKVEVRNEEDLIQAVSHDYVCATYKSNKRSNENYISTNCLAMDVDNDFSKNKEDWIDANDIAEFFKDVEFLIHFSRHNEKAKDKKSARPRFHIFFPIDEVKSFKEYRKLKETLNQIYPYFDSGAIDAARFF